MELRDLLLRLFGRELPAVPLTAGASGAKLWKIADGKQMYVLKYAHPVFSRDAGLLAGYRKEVEFYEHGKSLALPFLPDIVHAEQFADGGTLLLMPCYEPIPHDRWDISLLNQAVDLCARLNSLPAEMLTPMGLEVQPIRIDPDFTAKAYEDWRFVLRQHKDRFDETLLDEIYENIAMVCPILNAGPYCVCHGDFHPDNLLWSDNDHGLRLCDWQNVHVGKHGGDMSFFIARGNGFGIPLNPDGLLAYYCEKLSEYAGMPINPTAILKERHASALLVTLSYWANYLKDCPAERVAVQFDDMADAYRYLCEH